MTASRPMPPAGVATEVQSMCIAGGGDVVLVEAALVGAAGAVAARADLVCVR